MGDAPFPAFSVAMLESDLPGGHSPAYFAVINNPLPTTPFVWRNDPATFNDFPGVLPRARGGAPVVGPGGGLEELPRAVDRARASRSTFAALYAREKRGDGVFRSALRNLRRWSMEHSDQGPISLGYRLGHVKGEPRVFRAVVYNKGAAVLHMLRRLIGDEAFFSGPAQFYAEFRYRKAGTDDVRQAMEKAQRPAARALLRALGARHRPAAGAGDHGRQGRRARGVPTSRLDEVFDLPVTVTLQYADGTAEDVVVLDDRGGRHPVAAAAGSAARASTSTATTPRSAPSSGVRAFVDWA